MDDLNMLLFNELQKENTDLRNREFAILDEIQYFEGLILDYIRQHGISKVYTHAGTYHFKVPEGITTLYVSAIGGGGGGGGGGGSLNVINNSNIAQNAGAGGGGGGYGTFIIDQEINVNSNDIVTVVVGAAGVGGIGGSRSNLSENGGDGGTTTVSKGENIIISVAGGTGGSLGPNANGSSVAVGGGGGTTAGENGGNAKGGTMEWIGDWAEWTGSGGTKGSGGVNNVSFGAYGDGGDGGQGANTAYSHNPADKRYLPGENGNSGRNGAVAICFGGSYRFADINWEAL